MTPRAQMPLEDPRFKFGFEERNLAYLIVKQIDQSVSRQDIADRATHIRRMQKFVSGIEQACLLAARAVLEDGYRKVKT